MKISGSTPSTALFASLQSPCFFHQRFDDAVNIDRVLEEVAAEDNGMSHSRLIQTATSVREISKQLQRRPIRRAVHNVMIVTKARDNGLVYLTRELTEWLLQTPRYNSDLGVNVYVDAKLRNSKRFDAASLIASNPRYAQMFKYWTPDLCWTSPEQFDLVITLGGDGTVLHTSWLFQRIVPPVLSFSLGSLGFLTNFEFEAYKTHLDRVMGEQGMRVNLRMRFTCTIYRAASRQLSSPSIGSRTQMKNRSNSSSNVQSHDLIEGEQFEVLNELVIDRGPSPYVSNLELYGDNELLTVVQADGCIISTPTGSTAYSLSAGGPLTHPSIPGMVLTPICPHTLSFRPMVLSDTLLLKVCVPRSSRSTAYASFDGKGRVELRRGDCVQVEAGRYPFPTVVGEGGTGGEWFESVRRSLRWNNRGAVQKSFGGGKNGVTRQTPGSETDDLEPKQDMYTHEIEEDDDDIDEEWDIDADPIGVGSIDSGLGTSEGTSACASPARPKDSSGLD
jgi:NAD+ kinase